MKRPLRHWLEEKLGLHVSRLRPGARDLHDIATLCPVMRTIIDVGANNGEMAVRYRQVFKAATIHCFEPVRHTYEQLRARFAGDTRTSCHQLGLSDAPGSRLMFVTAASTTCSMLEPPSYDRTETVAVTTLDAFVADQEITSIDLLKIDVEGYDLDVLRGASVTLRERRIRTIFVEVGFQRHDSRHSLFDDVRDYLAAHDMRIYAFYDQTLEWDKTPGLRFANALFVRHTVE